MIHFNKKHDVVQTDAGVSLHFHLYYMICVSFVWQYENMLLGTLIYFISDTIFQILNRSTSNFLFFHHSLVILCCVLKYTIDVFDYQIIHLLSMHEISSIVLVLNDLHYIKSQYLFDKLFSFLFITFRLVIFNFCFYRYMEDKSLDLSVFTTVMIFNLMNIGIARHLKLMHKLFCE